MSVSPRTRTWKSRLKPYSNGGLDIHGTEIFMAAGMMPDIRRDSRRVWLWVRVRSRTDTPLQQLPGRENFNLKCVVQSRL